MVLLGCEQCTYILPYFVIISSQWPRTIITSMEPTSQNSVSGSKTIIILISTSWSVRPIIWLQVPPSSWQKPSEALAWLAAWCTLYTLWFVLFWIFTFSRGQAGGHFSESKVFTVFQTAALVWEKAGRAWSGLHETAVINATTLPHLDLRRISFRFLRKFRTHPYFLQNQYLSLTDSTSKSNVGDLWQFQ